MDSKDLIHNIALHGNKSQLLDLYEFNIKTPKVLVLKKFKVFGRTNFPRFFTYSSASFHDTMILNMIDSYYGMNYLNIASRGLAKTALKKLFDAFVLLNDTDCYRKYMKILSKDLKNSKQIVTDVYNLIIELKHIYGDVFEKEGDKKREETMIGFTMKNGRKYSAGTVGQTQRGHIQDAYRPDWIGFEDIEDRESVRSVAITESIINSVNEAIDGLSKEGSYMVNANYISDQGVIQHIKNKSSVKTQITPIADNDYNPTWPERDTKEDILILKKDADDFFGEYMCDPARAETRFFDIDRIQADLKNCKPPSRQSAGVRYWSEYKPNHRYGQGSDHSEGIGLDSNALALFDFTTGELVADYASNTISPDMSAHEFARVGFEFGNCLYAPEINNKCGGIVITTLKQLNYPNIYVMDSLGRTDDGKTKRLGWETNSKTKYNMFYDFRTDYQDGLIKIYDEDVLKEMKAYSNADLQGEEIGLITRHFDLLTACVIAWQMRKHAVTPSKSNYKKAYEKYANS